MNIMIRQCVENDLPELLRLYRQLQPEDTTTPDELAEAFARMQAFPGCAIFMAQLDGRMTGAFTLYLLPNTTRNGRPAAILENIIVDEPYRGRDIGRAMLEFVRERAREQNCYKLSLTSNAKRQEAHAFYLRCGMVQHGLSFRYVL